MIRTVKAGRIKVKLNTEVTSELVEQEKPDVLIAALGAAPLVPDINGVDGKNVILGVDCHNDDVQIGRKVVIIGGGSVGCEAAVSFNREGKDVTIIEMLTQAANDVNNSYRFALLLEMEKGVKLEYGRRCTEITNTGVKGADADGNEYFYEADTVILATGMKSRAKEVDALRSAAPEFCSIGDCVNPGKILDATRSGYNAAMDI
jgi:pyruvate/2-oxoglutarate dehydrogenase complex dihydrolipoamide dehydrogenase (E3) component